MSGECHCGEVPIMRSFTELIKVLLLSTSFLPWLKFVGSQKCNLQVVSEVGKESCDFAGVWSSLERSLDLGVFQLMLCITNMWSWWPKDAWLCLYCKSCYEVIEIHSPIEPTELLLVTWLVCRVFISYSLVPQCENSYGNTLRVSVKIFIYYFGLLSSMLKNTFQKHFVI